MAWWWSKPTSCDGNTKCKYWVLQYKYFTHESKKKFNVWSKEITAVYLIIMTYASTIHMVKGVDWKLNNGEFLYKVAAHNQSLVHLSIRGRMFCSEPIIKTHAYSCLIRKRVCLLFTLSFTIAFRSCNGILDAEGHMPGKVRPRTSAWYYLCVEATRRNLILRDLPVESKTRRNQWENKFQFDM